MPLRRQHLQRCLAVLCLVVLTFSAARSYAQSTTTLYTFTGGADGGNPKSTLSMDPAGNLYGTTTTGGAAGNGTVFKIDTSQIFSVIHSFGADEGHPIYGLVMDSSGNLYGTTYNGGASDLGTIFKIDTSSNYSAPPLPVVPRDLAPSLNSMPPTTIRCCTTSPVEAAMAALRMAAWCYYLPQESCTAQPSTEAWLTPARSSRSTRQAISS
jgi:uncharacterized repeat protein (TIGR03803 family)